MKPDEQIMAIQRIILSAVTSRLNAAGRPVGRSFVAPGSRVVWDDCCEGQAWVRLEPGGLVVSNLGRRGTSAYAERCAITLNGTLAVGVLRCAHTVDDNGVPPSPEEIEEDTAAVLADMADLLHVLNVDLADVGGLGRLTLVSWSTLGPSGGCVGGEWLVEWSFEPCATTALPAPPEG